MIKTNLEIPVKLSDYLPDFMKSYSELNEIMKSEDPEFNLLYGILKNELFNQFIETADIEGIKVFESILNINVDETLDLNTRRFNIINLWGGELPYTHRNLMKKLNQLCGENGYKLEIKHNEYTVNIITSFIDNNRKNFLLNSLRNIIPANMIIANSNEVNVVIKTEVYVGLNFSEYKQYRIGG